MRVRSIHVLRKPLCKAEGTVAANVLKHGCGGINIDATRIGVFNDGAARACTPGSGHSTGGDLGGSSTFRRSNPSPPLDENKGRWPANLILQHKEGCAQEGTKRVKASSASSGPTLVGHSTSFSRGLFKDVDSTPFYADSEGKETVPNWICEQGCPVRALDDQSGIVPTDSWCRQKDGAHPFGNAEGSPYEKWQDMKEAPGGASRFFKQVRGQSGC